MTNQPGLFGIHHSNKDFSNPANWGKNQFNNAFPIALCCYMSHVGLKPVFIMLNKELKIQHQNISVSDLFQIDPASPETFFAFEHNYFPYQKIVDGSLESADVVISNKATGTLLRGLDIKLTALPDTTTCHLLDQEYGCELVVRPNTISYVALSIANSVLETVRQQQLQAFLEPVCSKIRDWTDEKFMLLIIDEIKQALSQFFISDIYDQQPVIVQPVWKTVGKSSQLHKNCLDVFVWSDLALA
ncbi:HindVP family restriction endonuclease [Leptolyngbyaceae cyanobacterium UHCC 1019]